MGKLTVQDLAQHRNSSRGSESLEFQLLPSPRTVVS
ncbi:unnamed protein product [Tuber melanosporum]|uniref:(Perigord truffle) hypothetical protein n=1 Tax=Tuber melanosporum (strain Mel28) TaxID=656061 RepID=D5GA19_TUBMM|nr:uncharacterized protein GSTUM_00003502001 [Tuber melanosporum]CAZ81362.1 unnamed protein product [Tuber melanosporum]